MNSAIIFEGGAMRGLFSAGVSDYLISNKIEVDNIYAISISSIIATNYLMKQKDKSRIILMQEEQKIKAGFFHFLRYLEYLNLDAVVSQAISEDKGFDYQKLLQSKEKLQIVVTNIDEGKAEYVIPKNKEELASYVKATCSLPLLSHVVKIGSKRYLDGGISDILPIERAIKENDKVIVVLTREKGYRKKKEFVLLRFLSHLVYHKDKELLKEMKTRAKRYNNKLDLIEKLAEENKIVVIYPSVKSIKRIEHDKSLATNFYNNGLLVAENEYNRLISYLKE